MSKEEFEARDRGGCARVHDADATAGFLSILIAGINEAGLYVTEMWTLGQRQVEIIENFFQCRRSEAPPALDAIAGSVHYNRAYAKTQKQIQEEWARCIIRDLLDARQWGDAAKAMVKHDMREVEGYVAFVVDNRTLIQLKEVRNNRTMVLCPVAPADLSELAIVARSGITWRHVHMAWDEQKLAFHKERIERNRVVRPLFYEQMKYIAATGDDFGDEYHREDAALCAAFAAPLPTEHDQRVVGRPIPYRLV